MYPAGISYQMSARTWYELLRCGGVDWQQLFQLCDFWRNSMLSFQIGAAAKAIRLNFSSERANWERRDKLINRVDRGDESRNAAIIESPAHTLNRTQHLLD